MSRAAHDQAEAEICDEGLCLTVGQATDAGLVRSQNQDAADCRMPADASERATHGALFAVCDGIGGLSEGRFASGRVVQTFLRAYYEAGPDAPERLLRRAAAQANADLYRERRRFSRSARMGTTLVAAAILPRELWVLNVGDSRAYIWRGGHLSQISRDHTPDPLRRLNDRRIDRALGTGPEVQPDVFGPIVLQAGDRVLLCSDGLTTAVTDRGIAGVIGEFAPVQAARQLVERARTAGAQDNVTVLLVGLDAVAPQGQPVGAAGRSPLLLEKPSLSLSLAALRRLWEQAWAVINPAPLIAGQGWRTPRGLLILVGWVILALILGLMLGLVFGSR